jgi:hypothetical protein
LNKARDIFTSHLYAKEVIFCSIVEADIELREEKFDVAKLKFKECLHSNWGSDIEVQSFCLERLADIRAWPTSEWQFI